MIKVNLGTRKQSTATAEARSGGGGSLLSGGGGLGSILEKLRGGLSSARSGASAGTGQGIPFRKVLVAAGFCIAANYLSETQKAEDIKKIDEEVARVDAKKAKLAPELAKMKGYEELKASFDSDLFTMRTKIETIQKLAVDRYRVARVFRSLSSTLPKDAWISEFSVNDRFVHMRGQALGFSAISELMKSMSSSIYFTDVDFKQATQSWESSTNTATHTFEFEAKER